MKPLTIGIVARRAGVNVETVRFYERKDLIERPSRRGSGYRQYPEETIDRIRFIRRAKELGFTLNEISELLSLKAAPRSKCDQIRRRAELKIQDIQTKVRDLLKMRDALAELAKACTGNGPVSSCPILEALES